VLYNGTCSTQLLSEKKGFGDYQFFLSYGGDQYLDLPNSIDGNFGTSGIVIHVSHFIAGQVFELTGYTTFGNYFLHNTFYLKKCYFGCLSQSRFKVNFN
jgi:hypothetical protein